MQVSRRQFLAAVAAGMVMTAEGLWMPGQKLISIPSRKIFLPAGKLAWMEDGVMYMYSGGRRGGRTEPTLIPKYFDVHVRGAEIVREALKRNSGRMAQ